MNYYRIEIEHRRKKYVALNRKGETQDDAVRSIIDQFEMADRGKGKAVIPPKIISVKQANI